MSGNEPGTLVKGADGQPIVMHEDDMPPQVRITANGLTARVEVNGRDVGGVSSRCTLELNACELPRLTLGFDPLVALYEGPAAVQVELGTWALADDEIAALQRHPDCPPCNCVSCRASREILVWRRLAALGLVAPAAQVTP